MKSQDHGHDHNAQTESFFHAKMFRAQRNMYLTGAVIFLSLVLNRFYNMIVDLHRGEEKMDVLKQQAAKTTKEYLKLLDKGHGSNPEVEKLKQELEIIKKQAKQNYDDYMALTDKYVALEQKHSKNDKKND